MSQSNLITASELSGYLQISSNIPSGDLDRFIQNAQRSNLRYWLGDDLYYNLCENRADGDKYQALLDGEVYEYTSGQNRYFDGIKPLLAWSALYFWAIEDKNKSTKAGRVIQNKRNSIANPPEEIERSIAYIKGQMVVYHQQLKNYMDKKSALFTEYCGIKDMQLIKLF